MDDKTAILSIGLGGISTSGKKLKGIACILYQRMSTK